MKGKQEKDVWRDIDPFNSDMISYLDPPVIDGEWCSPLSPKDYYTIKKIGVVFTLIIFILWLFIMMVVVPY